MSKGLLSKVKLKAKKKLAKKMTKVGATKKTGKSFGKSNKPGMGGRSEQLLHKGVPKAVVGMIARSKGEAPGQAGFHKG